jgi:RHS repeat-associated protein
VQIVETVGGAVTSTRQFVFADGGMCEIRDGSGNVTNQLFKFGETISSNKYFFAYDRLGSVRGLSDINGIVQSEYTYSPYGAVTKIRENVASDFLFASLMIHSRSGLNLSRTRLYNSTLGRWLSRDPLASKGLNLYAYVAGDPINSTDPTGLITPTLESGTQFTQAIGKLAGMCECPKCLSDGQSASTCRQEAAKISLALWMAWLANFNMLDPRNQNYIHVGDIIGGHICWDWAALYHNALNALNLTIWDHATEHRTDSNGFVFHYAEHIWIKQQNGCEAWADDGWGSEEGQLIHYTPPFPTGWQ